LNVGVALGQNCCLKKKRHTERRRERERRGVEEFFA
jgi:hypothetical protein